MVDAVVAPLRDHARDAPAVVDVRAVCRRRALGAAVGTLGIGFGGGFAALHERPVGALFSPGGVVPGQGARV